MLWVGGSFYPQVVLALLYWAAPIYSKTQHQQHQEPSFTAATVAAKAKPHIVTVIVDDWGWNNWGYHARDQANSREVKTPHMDALAEQGIVLERHYVFPVCSPSRAAFQTGRNPLHVTAVLDIPYLYNTSNPDNGFTGIPRKMTGIAEKMAEAGYQTHFAGKWHIARGYSSYLGYLFGANDYWTCGATGVACGGAITLADLWEDDGPALRLKPASLCSVNSQAGCVFEEELFEARVNDTIAAYDAAGGPMFLVYAPHAVHTPLQPPAAASEAFDFIEDTQRRAHAAIVHDLDQRLGRIVQLLKDRGMWSTTLLLVTADNGGANYRAGGASNYPLRGGKLGHFEGGVRANAFVSGGFVPEHLRGTAVEGLIGIEDWYATFAGLAGVDAADAKAAMAGLPPIDSFNVWPYLTGEEAQSPRQEVFVAAYPSLVAQPYAVQVVIDSQGYKLLVGNVGNDAYSPAVNPVNDTPGSIPPYPCGPLHPSPPFQGACLFNIFSDPYETTNLAEQLPHVLSRLGRRLIDISSTGFTQYPGLHPGNMSESPSCRNALENLSGFHGPYVD